MYSNSHSAYRRVQPCDDATVLRGGLQWVPPTSDVGTLNILMHFLKYLITSSLGTYGNDPKTTRTKKPHPFLTSDESLRSIGRQMHPQGPLISVRCQKSFIGNWVKVAILAVMGHIFIFKLIILYTVMCFFKFLQIFFIFIFCLLLLFLLISSDRPPY